MHTSHHAAERLALFYPDADGITVLREVALGVPIEPHTANWLASGHPAPADHRYVLHRERTGVFVIAADNVVTTFLRFNGKQQHELACKLWPGGDPPTCVARWNRPEPDPRPVKLAKGVRAALRARLGVEELSAETKALYTAQVQQAVACGWVGPVGDYCAHPGTLSGTLEIEGILFGLCLDPDQIHVVAVMVRPEILRARRLAEQEARRRAEGERQAAELLRSRGWTCTPPQGGGEGT